MRQGAARFSKSNYTSQPETHAHLRPIVIFVCTNTQLASIGGNAGGQPSFQYLTSTRHSLIEPPPPSSTINSMGMQTLNQEAELSKAVISGHFSFPPRFPERDGDLSLLSMEELKGQMGRLQYWEHRHLTVQGNVIAAYNSRLARKMECSTLHSSEDSPSDQRL
ncbi:hypothetical protein EOD39_8706 [Acipenser ruthenus]|uniref:Uncharacterized protein n=1 Tax=Acipenser ruthenus TaxID=7906 RepID=A0A444U305_ACIRT|nr:hypothetical protein EOD39_8706 [Acipenser ruthenus]